MRPFALSALVVVCLVGGASAQGSQKLRVATRIVPPFIVEHGGELSGFSAELWAEIARELGVDWEYAVVESVPDLLGAVRTGRADLAVAAVSITSDRDKEFDFSQPIFDAGLQVLVSRRASGGGTLWSSVKSLFSPEVRRLLVIMAALVLVGAHLVWLAERRRQSEGLVETRAYVPGILKGLWWSAATMTTQADEMPRGYAGRLIAVLWMFMSVVVVAVFTAEVTTSLTVRKLQGAIQSADDLPGKRVATVRGSTAESYLRDHNIAPHSVDVIDDAYDALASGAVDAVVYDAPVLLYYCSHDGKGLVDVVGPVFQKEAYGIVVPPGSEWRRPINQVLLALREDGTYDRIYQKWFGEGGK